MLEDATFARPRFAVAPYLERAAQPANAVDRWLDRCLGAAVVRLPLHRSGLARRATGIVARTEALRTLDEAALQARLADLRPRLLRGQARGRAAAAGLAVVCEMARRTLGLAAYPVQVQGALGLLDGRLVEMATGEGKTLTAALAAATAALGGELVHVVTVNDYLAERDAERLAPLFEALGLDVGVVLAGMPADARRSAYGRAVTYVTNKELAFDYLKDRLLLQRRRGRGRRAVQGLCGAAAEAPVLRGLAFAIVDEADSVLIDEARTPLIISATRADESGGALYREALDLAAELAEGLDFRRHDEARTIDLTAAGKRRLTAAARGLGGLWSIRRAREELATQALSALHLFARDRDYILGDGKVQIVDEYTGRVMPDRSWQGGLHQMIETKEGVPVTDKRETVARITYQRLFRRYRRLAGMSGTVAEIAGEARVEFGLDTVRIPTHRRVRRRHLGTRLFRSCDDRWRAMAARVADVAANERRPVLIGTRSVAASEAAAAALAAAGVPHVVLNARQDAAEADIVAAAGTAGRVTVATNMAGRGTDIALGPGVAERGGLHVVLTEFHESARIDRQLFGRAARQGDPGTCEAFSALDDELFTRFAPGLLLRLTHAGGAELPGWLALVLARIAQARAEAEHATTRREQAEADRKMETQLAFSGPVE